VANDLDFGRLLREARGEKRQRALSDALDVSQVTWSAWEIEDALPRQHRLQAISDITGIPFDDLTAAWFRASVRIAKKNAMRRAAEKRLAARRRKASSRRQARAA
jgi:transcriptional regulator with XRE-family HTH domain